jgi:hypothetical protein
MVVDFHKGKGEAVNRLTQLSVPFPGICPTQNNGKNRHDISGFDEQSKIYHALSRSLIFS